jgi:glycine dehydrogenase subunit 1
MRYLPKSESDREVMLREIGAESVDDLFGAMPAEYRLKRDLNIPRAYAESEIVDFFRQRAAESAQGYATFLGAGAYSHYRPVVVDSLVSRGEFFTAYTPYQPEIAQGTLQSIVEFQTMICELTGMDVANASMYDGSTGAAEALMMAARITGRNKSVVASSVHPEYREVIATYARYQGMPVATVGYLKNGRVDLEALDKAIDVQTAGVLIQSPNFFGTIEDVAAVGEIVHRKGALLIVSIAEAVSLGIVKAPAAADIVSMEAQSFGVPLGFGGPYCGVIATRDKFVRQMPGRLVGEARPQRKARLCPDVIHARAAHPPREGDLEHLHQPGAGRTDVQHLHDCVRPGRTEGIGEAKSLQGTQCCRGVQEGRCDRAV